MGKKKEKPELSFNWFGDEVKAKQSDDIMILNTPLIIIELDGTRYYMKDGKKVFI